MVNGITRLMLIGATVFAAMAPVLFSAGRSPAPQTVDFPGWPGHYENLPLTPLDLSEKERLFVKGFPGEIARFSDGSREIIMRWIESPTRRLHSASDCFKGVGYAISPLPVQRNRDGVAMGCFSASGNTQTLKVCEYIARNGDGTGDATWSDVSAWYWHAIFDDRQSGWWSFVVAETVMQ